MWIGNGARDGIPLAPHEMVPLPHSHEKSAMCNEAPANSANERMSGEREVEGEHKGAREVEGKVEREVEVEVEVHVEGEGEGEA